MLVLLRVQLPEVVVGVIDAFAAMNTPVCMLIIGYSLHKIGLREVFRLERTSVIGLTGRFVITPLLTLGICILLIYMFPLYFPRGLAGAALPVSVFVVEAAMPVMNQCVVMAKYHGADSELATRSISASVLLMLPVIPLLILLCSVILR